MPNYGWDVASDSLREAVRSARRAAMFDLGDAASAAAVPQSKLRRALADLGRRGRCDSIAADAANAKDSSTRSVALSSRWCPPPAVRLTTRSDAPQVSAAVTCTAGWAARRFDCRRSKWPRHEIIAAVNGSELDLTAAAASSMNCPQATLAALAGALDEDVRVAAAQNDRCPQAVLAALVTDADFEVSYAAVRNPLCSPSVVAAAALHNDDSWIREASAGHPNCGPQLQRHLADDPDATVRIALAENSNARVETLEILAGDFNGAVIAAVCDNPNTTVSVIDTMARNEDPEVRAQAARHWWLCSRETLQRLAEDTEDLVRDAAATRQA